jgi:epoxyqueuosine reductase
VPPVTSSPPDRLAVAQTLREEARREGFLRAGFARADTPPHFGRFRDWLAAGRHASMAYLERTAAVRSRPEELLPGARTIVCLSDSYPAAPFRASDGSIVARYARGEDYHASLRRRAERVASGAARRLGSSFGHRVCVDTTPLCERSFAAAAGLGWIGKNGCLIDPDRGSWLLLAEIVTTLDLPPDEPVAEQCGSCTRCLRACPTQAFVSPGVLDARRCLAFWTIEHRGALPDTVKQAIGDRVFGCDICQEVCPWNGTAGPSPGTEQDPGPPSRAEWIAMGPGEWRRRFGRSAFNRAGRRGVQRNAAASAGATGERSLAEQLERAARLTEPGLSDAAAWAGRRLSPAG